MHLLKIYSHCDNKADGYFNLTTLAGTVIQIYNTSASNLLYTTTTSNNSALGCTALAGNGDELTIYYVFDDVRWFKFIYTVGAAALQ